MSFRGVKQLKELVIRYSDRDGSSRGIREWMSTRLVSFAESNPDLLIKTELKRNKHPILTGQYVNGNAKTLCIKNLGPTEVETKVLFVRNQIGKRVSWLRQCYYFVVVDLTLLSLCIAFLSRVLDEFNWLQEACTQQSTQCTG
jgi:hypothetical protein